MIVIKNKTLKLIKEIKGRIPRHKYAKLQSQCCILAPEFGYETICKKVQDSFPACDQLFLLISSFIHHQAVNDHLANFFTHNIALLQVAAVMYTAIQS